MAALEREIRKYKELLPSLSADEGKFALICGDDLIGTYSSYEDALKIGYEKCGLGPFLVQQVSQVEMTAYFTRDYGA